MDNIKNFHYNKTVKNKRKIKSIAKQIALLEKQFIQNNSNKDYYEQEINKLIENLTLQEILDIDIYIVENNLLKK